MNHLFVLITEKMDYDWSDGACFEKGVSFASLPVLMGKISVSFFLIFPSAVLRRRDFSKQVESSTEPCEMNV